MVSQRGQLPVGAVTMCSLPQRTNAGDSVLLWYSFDYSCFVWVLVVLPAVAQGMLEQLEWMAVAMKNQKANFGDAIRTLA